MDKLLQMRKTPNYPPEFWERYDEVVQMVKDGDMCEQNACMWVLDKMDYYGGIKEAERWWLSDSDRGIDIRPSYESGLRDRPKEGEKKIYG